jgi:hypothetical protein
MIRSAVAILALVLPLLVASACAGPVLAPGASTGSAPDNPALDYDVTTGIQQRTFERVLPR